MVITEFKILGTLPSVNQYLNREKTYSEAQSFLRKILEENYKGYIPLDFPIKIVIYHYLEEFNYNKEDIDNKQKVIQDAMKGIIIKDDSLICSIYSEKKIAKSEEYFTVLIEEFEETLNNNMGEIIGNIGNHKDKELKARELQLSIKDKKINELKEENEKLIKEIFKINLMNDGDYLVVNKNNFENYSKIEKETLTEADIQNYFMQS